MQGMAVDTEIELCNAFNRQTLETMTMQPDSWTLAALDRAQRMMTQQDVIHQYRACWGKHIDTLCRVLLMSCLKVKTVYGKSNIGHGTNSASRLASTDLA